MPVRLTVVGSINLDLVARTERLPRPGETVSGATFAQIPGGKGANQAVAAARLGAQVTLIGCVAEGVGVNVGAGGSFNWASSGRSFSKSAWRTPASIAMVVLGFSLTSSSYSLKDSSGFDAS